MSEINQTSTTGNAQQSQLPNSTAVLVLGIVSIALCWCYGIIGIALGIIGLVLGNKALALYRQSPEAYTEASYKNACAGRICSIIGLAVAAVYLILIAAFWSTYIAWVTSFINR
jgi:hypothetical protein